MRQKQRALPYFCNDLKRHFLSVWSLALGIPVAVLTLLLFLNLSRSGLVSLGRVPYAMGTPLLFVSFFCLIYAVYRAQSLTDYQLALVGRRAAVASLLLSLVCYSLAFFALLLAPFSVIWAVYGGPFLLWLSTAGYMLAQWFALTLLFSALGAALGLATAHRQAYVFAVFFFLPFTPLADFLLYELTSFSWGDPIYDWVRLFNLTAPAPFAPHYNLFGAEWTVGFLAKTGAVALLGVCFIGLIFLFQRHLRPALRAAGGGVSLLSAGLAVLLAFCYVGAQPVFYDFINGDKTNCGTKPAAECAYVVESQHLQVALQGGVEATAQLQLKVGQTDRLRLKLDEAFTVRSLKLNGASAAFQRRGDWLELPAPGGERATVEVTYAGRPNYEDTLWNRTIFVDENSCYLPECFAWYPQDPQAGYAVPFTLTVRPNNTLATNANGNRLFTGKQLQCSGSATRLYLVTGALGQGTYKGITVIGYAPFMKRPEQIGPLVERCLQEMEQDAAVMPPGGGADWAKLAENDAAYRQADRADIHAMLFLPYSYNFTPPGYLFEDVAVMNELALTGGE